MKDLEAIIAKHEAPATADPASEVSSAPPAGTSESGSAVADVDAAGGNAGQPASPTATNHDVLRAKLDREKAARQLKDERRQVRLAREQADQKAKEADAEREKWKTLGKDETWLAKIKATGRDPKEVFEEMRQEAMRSGTPDARIDALAAELREEKAARAKEREESAKERKDRETEERTRAENGAFLNDFKQGLGMPKYAPLLEEYEPEQLYQLANTLRRNPESLFTAARSLNVSLREADGTFTMQDIFDVMHATQAAHRERMQRRTQSAAPHTSQVAGKQATEVTPTVNGTVERKAGSTQTAPSGRDAEEEQLKKMSRSERRDYLAKKYP